VSLFPGIAAAALFLAGTGIGYWLRGATVRSLKRQLASRDDIVTRAFNDFLENSDIGWRVEQVGPRVSEWTMVARPKRDAREVN
jgi:hypothetical protein